MPDYTFGGIQYPVAGDLIKQPSLESKLADDMKALAVSAQNTITAEGVRIQGVAAADATQKAQQVVGTANSALQIASESNANSTNAVDRVKALEAAAGFGPSAPADGTTANLLLNGSTLTNEAVNTVIGEAAAADGALRDPLSDLFQSEFTITPASWVAGVGKRVVLPTHQPVSTDGQVVHPSVVFVPKGISGYKYWMAYTPYAGGNDAYEDPCIVASTDGNNWVVPAGLANPLDDAPGGDRFNSDTNIIFHDGKLYCFWRYADTRSSVWKITMYYRTSVDGVTWTPKQVAHEASMDTMRLMAPAFQFFGGKWHMWAVNNADPARPFVYMSADALGATGWSALRTCSLPVAPGYDRWHISVKRRGGQFVGIMNDTEQGGNGGRNANIYLITSSDGINWEKAPAPLVPRIGPDHNTMYAATFEVRGDSIDVWYSAIQQNPGEWHIFKTTAYKVKPGSIGASLSGSIRSDIDVTANGGKATVNITFPPGFFTRPPVVTAVSDNGRVSVSVSSSSLPTVDGAALNIFNWTTGNAARPTVHWVAIEAGA